MRRTTRVREHARDRARTAAGSLRRAKRQKAITIRPEYGRVRSGCECSWERGMPLRAFRSRRSSIPSSLSLPLSFSLSLSLLGPKGVPLAREKLTRFIHFVQQWHLRLYILFSKQWKIIVLVLLDIRSEYTTIRKSVFHIWNVFDRKFTWYKVYLIYWSCCSDNATIVIKRIGKERRRYFDVRRVRMRPAFLPLATNINASRDLARSIIKLANESRILKGPLFSA